jgi:hypothetical protein
MGKFARFKVSKMKQVGVGIDRVSTRSFSNNTYDHGYDNSAICIYISRKTWKNFECWSFGAKKIITGKI